MIKKNATGGFKTLPATVPAPASLETADTGTDTFSAKVNDQQEGD